MAALDGGSGLPRLDTSRLRATWLRGTGAGAACPGAKSDGGDAHMLADAVRTDAHQLRPAAGDSPAAEAVKVLARTHKTLIWERSAVVLRLRAQLREYFPAAVAAFEDLDARWRGGPVGCLGRLLHSCGAGPLSPALVVTTARCWPCSRAPSRLRSGRARLKTVPGPLDWVSRVPLLVAVCVAVGCLAAGCAVAGSGGPAGKPSRPGAGHSTPGPGRPGRSPGRAAPRSVVPAIGADPAQLAGQLTTAERVLGADAAPPAALAKQALIVQLACLAAAAHHGWAGAVLAQVAPAQRAAAATDLAATADLVALTPPLTRLPPWRIAPAKNLAALRADYHAAQAVTGVGWCYLAAINFVETDFGRVAGPSTAGAQGPMQFLPATWASYGHGNIHRPKDAILAAAHLLAAHGAAHNIAAAVYAYNPSWRYVDAVLRYARRLRRNPHSLAGYYHHQVICHLPRGWVLLPAGYGINPAAQPIALHP